MILKEKEAKNKNCFHITYDNKSIWDGDII